MKKLAALFVLAACGPGPMAVKKEDQAIASVKSYVRGQIDALKTASEALQAAAPDHAWDATADAAAISKMKVEWKKARVAYERVEGAIAVLFPDLDTTTDQRYDVFLADNGADAKLFDDQNVTGIHAIERVLYADQIPMPVKTFEMGLTGYQPAVFPATAAEAADFKAKLAGRMVADVKKMSDQFSPLALDSPTAFRGVIGSMEEQIEKLQKGESGEEESRYAQFTLADMRANVEAGKATYGFFKPWLIEKGGDAIDADVTKAFKRVDDAYGALTGDALPAVPSTWSSANPSMPDLQTPFGKLYTALKAEADPKATGSLVALMNAAADKMGIAQLPE